MSHVSVMWLVAKCLRYSCAVRYMAANVLYSDQVTLCYQLNRIPIFDGFCIETFENSVATKF